MRASNLILALIPLGVLACGDKTTGDDSGGDTDTPGTEGTADIDVNLSVLDFDEIEPGSSELISLTITNRGDETLNVTEYLITGAYNWINPQFFPPFYVPPGMSNTVYFSCKPDLKTSGGATDVGGATLIIMSDDPDEPEVLLGLSCDALTDADGDGYEVSPIGDDCDDKNASVNPDAEDEWYDGVDSNCDDSNDFDQDGDGYQSIVFFPNMIPVPAAEDTIEEGGSFYLNGDCQDSNPDIHPDHEDYGKLDSDGEFILQVNPNEVWYDGIDHNCDGLNDYDQDGDGYSSLEAGRGSDCDDVDFDINIDTDEKLNGADDNCDGVADQDVPAYNADYVYTGLVANETFGYSVVMGDLDKDGYDDVLAGAPGYSSNTGLVAVYDATSLPGTGSTYQDKYTTNTVYGASGTSLGATVAYYTDTRGFGNSAVAIGAPTYSSSTGIVYVITGANMLLGGTTSSAFLTITGSASSQRVGAGLSSEAELNGDGINDFIGRYTSSSQHNIWLLYGGVQGAYTLADVDATFAAGGSKTISERSMSPTGDINGDGYEDFVFCDYAANSRGELWVLWGSPSRYETLGGDLDTDGTNVFSGNNFDQLGKTCGIGPDMDGDGVDELWVHVIDGSDKTSGIYMIEGSTDLEDDGQHPYDIYTRRYITRGSDPGSYYFASVGDWDDDGVGDVAFGLDESGVSYGRVWIFSSGDEPGEYTASSDNHAFVEGDDDAFQEDFGSALSAIPGDIDGNGMADFVAGDSSFDYNFGLTANAGAVYVSFQIQ